MNGLELLASSGIIVLIVHNTAVSDAIKFFSFGICHQTANTGSLYMEHAEFRLPR